MTDQLERSLQTHLGATHTIQYELGGGGMSRVFVADDRALERKVAIKVLNPVLAATVSVARFEREIMVVARLNHPNIVPVLSAGQVDSLPYFIMPYIEGESLRARIVRGPLSMRETIGILKDVTRALAYAHSAGIVHRDIKPDNILLAGTAAVVTDFGVAKAVSAARDRGISSGGQPITGLGVSLGTPQYMAPEQAAADPSADHRADIYALGIVAYEMLVGSPPFHGRTPQALLAAQLTELPPPLASRRYDVPVELSALIMKCLEKDPADRPRAATDILRLLESPDALAGPVAAPPRAVANRRMKRLTTALGVTGVVLAVGGLLAWSFWPASEPPPAAPTVAARPAAVAAATVHVQPPVAIGTDSRDLATAISAAIETALVGSGVAVRTSTSPVDSAVSDSRAFILQTTIQRFGPQARANVRLSARGGGTDTTLWADKLDFRIDSALVAQDTLAARVVSAVRDAQLRVR
jgi:eukaryotic-like serine/threonine-protein kinase